MDPVRHLITAALPYANGPLHIGHLAGAYLPADVYVRFMRLMDKDIVFICGSDEHGAAITMRAMKDGTSPQQIIDKYHQLFESTFKGIGISFDYYGRTSDKIHHETSQEFFKVLYNKGVFEEKETAQYYDESVGQFLADRYITGTCPKCGYEAAYGDQCEQCGSSLNPTDLINPKSVLSGNTPIFKKTTHWYLPLEKDEKWLKEFIEQGTLNEKPHHDPDQWKSHVIGQCKSWIDNGLQSRAMTRDLDWGVDVPQDIPGSIGKKLYVWMDAPIGYLSATKQWAERENKDWKEYWLKEDTELIHFIGKDNIVFHCIIFPALLKAHGDFILPTNVPANQFMNLEDQKISTSRNWAIWVHEFLEDLVGHEDALRYYLIKNMPEQKDSEFTWKGFQEAYNNELVNNLSNFVHRVLVLTHKYYDGFVTDFDPDSIFTGVAPDDMGGFHDTECLYLFDKLDELNQCHRDFDFRAAMKCLMEISTQGNQLLQLNEPWKNQKEDPEMVEAIMNLALHYVTALSVAMHPFLPFASNRLRKILNLPEIQSGDMLRMMDQLAEGEALINVGHKLNTAEYLFTKIDDELIQKQIDKLHLTNVSNTELTTIQYLPQKSEISYDDFMKMDIRTAKILEAEAVPKADKLLKLQVDLGYEKRVVVSGIAEYFKPTDIIGKEVLILANLAPRTIRGIESKGMILMAENESGQLSFVSPDQNWPSGFSVK
ncbi:MAG: methionine--tRNA ligase [Saprospiraceae bacterium]|nr:methionine--tRNA ligase [Saprospiraceae bacterium]MBK7810264.1 methionine--tRNA ligase [Saprospiraceae bacterium]MBK9629867.1 methionine--tRNA ligase [Saprospiraceae bacterium]